MFILMLIVHIMACFVLVAVILLQAGRGGGLSEALGGEAAQSLLGTQAPTLLKKATTISAIVFLITSLLLGMMTARKGKSLFQQQFPMAPMAPQQGAVPAAQPVAQPEQGQPAEETQ
ncbi:MAG: preprotein translocase subunit SecG [Candidatus Omnitrophota bacterium]